MTTLAHHGLELLQANGLAPRRAARPELRGRPEHRAAHRPVRRRRPGTTRSSRSAPDSVRSPSPSPRPGAQVLAIEVDDGLVPVLRKQVAGHRRTSGWSTPTSPGSTSTDELGNDQPWVLVANLPYNIATPLVADVLDEVPAVQRMLVMVQKEVGERFVAVPRTPAYGAVSVKIAYWAEARIDGLVPPTVFLPEAERRLGARLDRAPPEAGRAR